MTTTPTFAAFATDQTEPFLQGADALRYVMAHGHASTVPDAALDFAERVAVVSLAGRASEDPVVAHLNRAIDLIAGARRLRAQLEADAAFFADLRALARQRAQQPPPPAIGGQRVRRPQPIVPLPPASTFAARSR